MKITSAECLLDIGRAVPVAGKPHTSLLVKHSDRDFITATRLAIICHTHLKRSVTINADRRSIWISDILDVCLAIKRRRTGGTTSRSSSYFL